MVQLLLYDCEVLFHPPVLTWVHQTLIYSKSWKSLCENIVFHPWSTFLPLLPKPFGSWKRWRIRWNWEASKPLDFVIREKRGWAKLKVCKRYYQPNKHVKIDFLKWPLNLKSKRINIWFWGITIYLFMRVLDKNF